MLLQLHNYYVSLLYEHVCMHNSFNKIGSFTTIVTMENAPVLQLLRNLKQHGSQIKKHIVQK